MSANGESTGTKAEELNRIGGRLIDRAAAISGLALGARDALGCASTVKHDLLAVEIREGLTVEAAIQAILALCETIETDAEELQGFELSEDDGGDDSLPVADDLAEGMPS